MITNTNINLKTTPRVVVAASLHEPAPKNRNPTLFLICGIIFVNIVVVDISYSNTQGCKNSTIDCVVAAGTGCLQPVNSISTCRVTPFQDANLPANPKTVGADSIAKNCGRKSFSIFALPCGGPCITLCQASE